MSQAVALRSQWNAEQLGIIKEHLAPGISDAELSLFGMVCQRTGLDPFSRQIYAIMRSQKEGNGWTKKMSIQTGIDGYRLIAARTGELAGIDDVVYDADDAEEPRWARVTVYRFVKNQRVPFTATARMKEYRQDSSPMWRKMPFLMLGKVAEALALRKAFPAELSGLYTREEMDQANEPMPLPSVQEERPRSATSDQQKKLATACRMLGYEMLSDEEYAAMTADEVATLIQEYRDEWQRRKQSEVPVDAA